MTRFIRSLVTKGRILGVIGSENYAFIETVYFIAPKSRTEKRKENKSNPKK